MEIQRQQFYLIDSGIFKTHLLPSGDRRMLTARPEGGGAQRWVRDRANTAAPGELCPLESVWCRRRGQGPGCKHCWVSHTHEGRLFVQVHSGWPCREICLATTHCVTNWERQWFSVKPLMRRRKVEHGNTRGSKKLERILGAWGPLGCNV